MNATATAPMEQRNGPAHVVEKATIQGDLGELSDIERLTYYARVCESLGLNPLTRPFEYILLNKQLKLYARKDCTDQLRKIHQVNVAITSREQLGDIYVVTARAALPGGRTDEDIGAVSIGGLKGNDLANAIMKAHTKAKRRVTLSICGLGILDESEIETVPDAHPELDVPRNQVPALPAPAPAPSAPSTPAPLPEPPLPAARGPVPGDPATLVQELKKREEMMVERGLCRPGDMLRHVINVCAIEGLAGSDTSQWKGATLKMAWEVARDFCRQRQHEKEKAAKAEKTAPATTAPKPLASSMRVGQIEDRFRRLNWSLEKQQEWLHDHWEVSSPRSLTDEQAKYALMKLDDDLENYQDEPAEQEAPSEQEAAAEPF